MNRKLSPKHKKRAAALMVVAVLIIGFFFKAKDEPVIVEPSLSLFSFDYSRHARCRMGCRHITEQEVADVIGNGVINQRKSNQRAGRCQILAVEKKTTDNQNVRVIYKDCRGTKKIITVIDLDQDHKCDC